MTRSGPGTIAFLGFGLIGGSIARALAALQDESGRSGEPRVTAWSPGGRGPAAALRDGVIAVAAADPATALAGAELVVIAAPPLATIELIGRLGSDLHQHLVPGAVVTDVASTKGAVMRAAAAARIDFVGGHPMAGRETAGYGSSSTGLFRDRPWVVVEPEAANDGSRGGAATERAATERATELVHWLAVACGARPLAMDATTHDAAAAAVSHLPLLVSAALVEAVAGAGRSDWPLARSLAASGWEGMTRLARGDAAMGAGIAATNAPAIVAQLRAFREAIDAWIADLDVAEPEAGVLEARLESVRATLPEPGR